MVSDGNEVTVLGLQEYFLYAVYNRRVFERIHLLQLARVVHLQTVILGRSENKLSRPTEEALRKAAVTSRTEACLLLLIVHSVDF